MKVPIWRYVTAGILAFNAGMICFAAACEAGCATLNPDPVHGGACHNGDQLGTQCKDTCCPDEYQCATDGHGCEMVVDIGPGLVGGKKARGDAGR